MNDLISKIYNGIKFIAILVAVLAVFYFMFLIYYAIAIVSYVIVGIMIACIIYLFAVNKGK
jgi:hypothetical protein